MKRRHHIGLQSRRPNPLHLILYISICLFAVLVALTGCGAKKTSSAGDRSSIGTVDTGTHKLGECSRIPYAKLNVEGQIGTYYDYGTHQYRGDYALVNLTTVPAEIFTYSSIQLKFFRWSERTAGGRIVNQTPTRLFFMDKLTGASTAANTVDRLSKSTIDSARNLLGKSWINVGTSQFFDRVLVVLVGLDLQYDAITVASYDSTVSSSPIGQGDVLLPAFAADPNVYKASRPYPSLYTIHPNYGSINSGGTESDYFLMIEDICRELAGGNRIPTSENSAPQSFIQRIWAELLSSISKIMNLLN